MTAGEIVGRFSCGRDRWRGDRECEHVATLGVLDAGFGGDRKSGAAEAKVIAGRKRLRAGTPSNRGPN